MKILILNAGSSSHKCCLYALEPPLPDHPPTPDWEAQVDWPAQNRGGQWRVKTAQGDRLQETFAAVPRREVLGQLLRTLHQGPTQVILSLDAIDGVGHRVVHGGQQYQSSVLVTAAVKTAIAQLSPLAPAHNPANLEGIELMEALLGEVPQVAVFDTAFHSHLPDAAAIYPGPYAWVAQGIRRYGFHGISHQYCAQRAAQLLGKSLADLRLIVCHLGNGASLTAVSQGQSIDTTMGFTPLDGLMMGTRSGAVDPGILIYLLRQGATADQLDHLLNREAGLKGISGVSQDLRDIDQAIAQGNPRAQLAREIYLHRLKSCLGSMLLSLGGLDALVFTAGVGEHAAAVRAATCEALAFLGLKLDLGQNAANPVDQDVAAPDSMVHVLVIHTQEDWAIAQDCWHCISPGEQPT